MKKQTLLYLLMLCLISPMVSAQQPGSRVPYTLFNDFETGELFGWETYPYAQDIAFDGLYACSIRVSVPGKPSTVQLNGQVLRGWIYDKGTGMFTLKAPLGKSDWKIMLK